jgi:hypothetical protein
LLRTNLQATTLSELWSNYMQLTEAEACFRTLKSPLSIRPLFHQLETRVKAHVMVAFLGYSLWVTLKHLLKRRVPIAPAPSAQRRKQCRAALAGESAGPVVYARSTAPILCCPPPTGARSGYAA